MGKYTVQPPRHVGEIQRVDEQGRGLDLPATVGPEEAPELLLIGSSAPRRLFLEGAERFKVTLSVDDPFHGASTKGANQLVLKVCDAHVEAESFHVGASKVGAEAGPLETAPEVALLCGVTQARQSEVRPLRTEPLQEACDVLRAPHRDDGDALGIKIPTTAHSERFERELVADPFDQHDGTCDEGRLSRRWAIETGVDPRPLVGSRLHAQQGIESDRE